VTDLPASMIASTHRKLSPQNPCSQRGRAPAAGMRARQEGSIRGTADR
jgi:hypothetical protein